MDSPANCSDKKEYTTPLASGPQASRDMKSQMNFHERNGVVVPHYEMSLEDVKEEPWLKEVVVGPTPDPDAAVWSPEFGA